MLRKKRLIKMSAIVLGAVLGWFAAGAVASDVKHDAGAKDGVTDHGGDGKLDMHLSVPAEDQSWYPMVLMAIGGLFVLAIIVGVGAGKLGKSEPGKIASDHDAAHAHH